MSCKNRITFSLKRTHTEKVLINTATLIIPATLIIINTATLKASQAVIKKLKYDCGD